jgi:hypothetical protein
MYSYLLLPVYMNFCVFTQYLHAVIIWAYIITLKGLDPFFTLKISRFNCKRSHDTDTWAWGGRFKMQKSEI